MKHPTIIDTTPFAVYDAPRTTSKPRPKLLTLRYAEISEALAVAHIHCAGEMNKDTNHPSAKEDVLRALDDALKDITEWREAVLTGRYDDFDAIPADEMLSLF